MTSRIVRPALVLAGVVALTGLSWTGATAVARLNAAAPPANPVIATIDLEAVVEELAERKDKLASLTSSLADAQKKVDNLVAELKSDQSKIEALTGTAKDVAVKELREKAIRAEFEKQYAQKLLIEMQGEMLRDLYLKISDATKRLAKKNGYSLVMTSDEKVEVPKGDPEAITRAIALKRMLYVDSGLDITNEVVAMMNNEYAATRK